MNENELTSGFYESFLIQLNSSSEREIAKRATKDIVEVFKRFSGFHFKI